MEITDSKILSHVSTLLFPVANGVDPDEAYTTCALEVRLRSLKVKFPTALEKSYFKNAKKSYQKGTFQSISL